MKNVYHSDIVGILLDAGEEGLKPCTIARKIFNRHADLFADDVVYEGIHNSVKSYLWRDVQRRGSVFQHKTFGVYAIKPAIAIQLDLFVDIPTDNEETEEEYHTPSNAVQLDLFAEFGM